MYLRLGFHIFSKNLIANIILIIQLAVSIILLNIVMGIYNEAYSKLEILSGFDLDNTVYQCLVDELISEPNIGKYKEKLGVSDDIKIEPIMEGAAMSEYGSLCCVAYGSNTSTSMRLPMKSGLWYDDCEKEDGCINAVVLGDSRYKIGDVYEMTFFDYSSSSEKTYSFKITGIADENTGVVMGNKAANILNTKVMFEIFDKTEYGGDALLLFDYQDSDIEGQLFCLPSLFAFSENGAYMSEKDIDAFKRFGSTFTMRNIYDNTKEELKSEIHGVLPIAISITFIGIIGIICLVILNTLKSRKTFAVYFICGMRWKSCIKIIIGHILCIFAGAVFLSVAFGGIMYASGTFAQTHLLIKPNNLFMSVALLAAVFAVSVATAKFMISDSKPVASLKND